MGREATITRKTGETEIQMKLMIDGKGKCEIVSGIGFFDHMLSSFAKHGGFDLSGKIIGDLNVDCHHTIEDTGIVLGEAIKQALGDKKGIRRYASFTLPMDDALVLVAVDLCNRPYLNFNYQFHDEKVGYFDTAVLKEFFAAVSYSAGMNIHIKVLDGENAHHIIEAIFKAFANALRVAATINPECSEVLSTKGTL